MHIYILKQGGRHMYVSGRSSSVGCMKRIMRNLSKLVTFSTLGVGCIHCK